MLSALKDHPFAVEAFFDNSLVLTYAVPKDVLLPLLPPCLQPDTFEEKWGFVAAAIVETNHLRPKGFPRIMGQNFILTGYRVFVCYTTSAGKRLRGLYILGSETNQKKMAFFGNIFTHYQYKITDIALSKKDEHLFVHSKKSNIQIEVGLNSETVQLPQNSPFKTWKEARRFAGPLPFTFSYNQAKEEVLIIEGVRQNWTPRPVEVIKAEIGFIAALPFNDCVLANAFHLENIPYHWKKGTRDSWKR